MKINNGRKGFTQDHRARERAFAYLLNRAPLSYLYSLSFSYIQFQFCFQLPMGEECEGRNGVPWSLSRSMVFRRMDTSESAASFLKVVIDQYPASIGKLEFHIAT